MLGIVRHYSMMIEMLENGYFVGISIDVTCAEEENSRRI